MRTELSTSAIVWCIYNSDKYVGDDSISQKACVELNALLKKIETLEIALKKELFENAKIRDEFATIEQRGYELAQDENNYKINYGETPTDCDVVRGITWKPYLEVINAVR